MIISHRHRFIFVKTTKTAGTSVEATLARFCGPEDVITPVYPLVEGFHPRNQDRLVDHLREVLSRGVEVPRLGVRLEHLDHPLAASLLPHAPAVAIRALYPEEWDSYQTFTVERNPWDKVVSGYYDHRRNYLGRTEGSDGPTFVEYVPWGLGWLSGEGHWTDTEGTRIVDRILRFENLGPELSDLLAGLGIDHPAELRVRAKSGYRPSGAGYRDHYDDETRELVARRQRKVIEALDYRF